MKIISNSHMYYTRALSSHLLDFFHLALSILGSQTVRFMGDFLISLVVRIVGKNWENLGKVESKIRKVEPQKWFVYAKSPFPTMVAWATVLSLIVSGTKRGVISTVRKSWWANQKQLFCSFKPRRLPSVCWMSSDRSIKFQYQFLFCRIKLYVRAKHMKSRIWCKRKTIFISIPFHSFRGCS